MRILDENGNEITTYDKEEGYLTMDTVMKHVEAVEGVEEQGHYNVLKTYENGGVTAEYVVDVPYVEAIPEHDEREEIYRYTPFTEKEKANRKIKKLKAYLAETDYMVIKCMESGVGMKIAYPEAYQKRVEARAEINRLEEI